MARYYFHIQDGRTFLDQEGSELPGTEAARAQARLINPHEFPKMLGTPWSGNAWKAWVSDEAGETLMTLHFGSKAGTLEYLAADVSVGAPANLVSTRFPLSAAEMRFERTKASAGSQRDDEAALREEKIAGLRSKRLGSAQTPNVNTKSSEGR
jgi:hypothetical protein